MELWTMTVPTTKGVAERVQHFEAAGWDGVTFTDSQNLCPDPSVVMGSVAGATESIGLADHDRAVVARVGEEYDSNEHLRNDAGHTAVLDGEFTDRFAVTGPGIGTPPEQSRLAHDLMVNEVLPAVHDFTSTSERTSAHA